MDLDRIRADLYDLQRSDLGELVKLELNAQEIDSLTFALAIVVISRDEFHAAGGGKAMELRVENAEDVLRRVTERAMLDLPTAREVMRREGLGLCVGCGSLMTQGESCVECGGENWTDGMTIEVPPPQPQTSTDRPTIIRSTRRKGD